ncbi:DUF7668 domain-containing protein [Enterovibrio norvegicus]|uniref:DUF7668 domain-containing protein n=1 Tax=Enterovibrio norvegicus TaxID=188144 RepID=UPI000C867733|nr:hypothetical protein [Enterovibrio norvegicus]PMN62809.1 hypothetical protein BCT27_11210 [Enterovibrio norvegicus]
MNEVVVVKDEDNELPIPTIWRPIFKEIVSALAQKDYLLKSKPRFTSPMSQETADYISEYIEDYGETLIDLPDKTWDSSTCLWMGSKWEVLIDLWTDGEGRSDLALKAEVEESETNYLVTVEMVYVP